MIIKRFDGTNFVELFPKTKAQQVFDSAGTTAIFDSNNKIKEAYLPNSVFDSLYFFGAVSTATADLRNLGLQAVADASTESRSPIGYYWVITSSTGATVSSPSSGTTDLDGVFAGPSSFIPGEEGNDEVYSEVLETGDWFILTAVSGAGTTGSPYSFTFATVNNTYELMTGADGTNAGAPGLVPGPSASQNLSFLRGDGTWQLANNYSHPNHTGDVTSDGDGDTTIAAGVVTLEKMADLAANTIIGNNTASDATPIALTASEVRAFLNVEDGANAYSHPNHTGDVTSDGDGDTTIVDDAVTEAKIADDAVTGAKIATNAVTVNKIAAGAVTEAKIGADAVTTNKIDDDAVTFAKIQNGLALSVIGRSANSIGDFGAITAGLDGYVLRRSGTSLGFGTIATEGIGNAQVTNAKLADMAGFRIKGRSISSTGDPGDLTMQTVRSIANLAPILYGGENALGSNTPVSKTDGMADGTAIPIGTIWYDTTGL